MMEELMPELVEMVLSRVDRLGLVACSFVCTTWMRITATSPPRREADHRRQWQEEEDWQVVLASVTMSTHLCTHPAMGVPFLS
jgi:hypothetical protein